MSIEVSWIVPGHAILTKHHDAIDDAALSVADQQVVNMLQAYPNHRIYVVVDVRHVDKTKLSLGALTNSLAFSRQANMQGMIAIHENRALGFMGKVFSQVVGKNLLTATTTAEALHILQAQLPNVDWSMVDSLDGMYA